MKKTFLASIAALSLLAAIPAHAWFFKGQAPNSAPVIPPATITQVANNPSNGFLTVNGVDDIDVFFNTTVTVASGTPILNMNIAGATANYVSGSGTNKLRFHFVTGSGQNTPDLMPAATSAINLNGATIRNQSNQNADLTGANGYDPTGTLVVDTTPPTVSSVTIAGNGIANGSGTIGTGTTVTFTVSFSENVLLASGPPSLSLNNGGTATYVSGAGTSSYLFTYTVVSGQDTAQLAVSAFNLNGGTLRDQATNTTNTSGAIGPSGNVTVNTGQVTAFTTSFPATENPMSQSNQWIQGCLVSSNWGCIQSQTNLAFGTSQSSEFGNDIAVLAGTWAHNQSAQATLKVNPAPGPYVEVNLRLNTTITATSITGYDIVCSVSPAASPYLQINRWNGPLAPAGNPNGDFTNLNATAMTCANGDVLKATNANGLISVYRNDMTTPVLTANDTTYTGGSPGIEIKNNNVAFGNSFGNAVGVTSFTATGRTSTGTASFVTASGAGIVGGSGSVVTGDIVSLTVNFPTNMYVSIPAATCSAGTFYVSNSGNDSNAGTSSGSPWQTINKVNQAHLDAGSCVKFNGGQTFADKCLRISPGTNVFSSNATNPIVFGSYGSGRATLDGASDCAGGTALAGVLIGGGNATLRGITFQDLILRNSASRTILDGINVYGPVDTVLIQNVDISGYNVGVPGGANASHIVVDGGVSGAVNNVKIFGNKFHGASVTSDDQNAVYAHGGATNIQISGNEVYNMGGTPQNAVYGTLGIADVHDLNGNNRISYNLIHDIGAKANACGGASGIEEIQESGVIIEYNEIYRVQPVGAYSGCDWDAIDLDGGGVSQSYVQYNYIHDNFGTGLYGCVACYGDQTWYGNVYRYNVVVNNGKRESGTMGGIGFQGNSNPPNNSFDVYNNTVYQANGAPAVYNTMQSGGVFANNIIAVTDDQPFIDCNNFGIYNTKYRNNAYVNLSNTSSFSVTRCNGGNNYNSLASWKTATGDTTSFFTNVKPWAGTTPTGTCPDWISNWTQGPQPCPNQFLLSTASTAFIGTGLNLTQSPYNLNVGSKDYFGNNIPHQVGTGWNIGADGTGAGSSTGGGGGTGGGGTGGGGGTYVGPLDAVGGTSAVAACYSIRACSVAAATAGVNAYQLVRTSDAASLNVTLLASGMADETAAASFCGGTTCVINKWYDQTGHSVNDVYPVDQVGTIINTRRPYWVPSCLNSVACLQFTQVNVSDTDIKMLATSTFTPDDNTQPYSVSYVAKYESVFNNDQFIVGTSEFATKSGVGHAAGGGYMIEVMENKFTVSVPDDGAWRNVQNTINGNSSAIMVNGVNNTGASGIPSSGQWAGLVSRFQIGSTKDDGYILYGKMAEVIVFGHTALNTTQNTNLCHNQRLFFGTGGSC